MADKQVDCPAPSEEVESLRRKITQLRIAIASTGTSFRDDWICWCGRCLPPTDSNPRGVRRSHKCIILAVALSSTATEKTEAENG